MILYLHSKNKSIQDGMEYALNEIDAQCTYINSINPNKLIQLVNLMPNPELLLKRIQYKRIDKLSDIVETLMSCNYLIIENLSLILSQANLDYNVINYQLIEIVKLAKLNGIKLVILDPVRNKFVSNIADKDVLVG